MSEGNVETMPYVCPDIHNATTTILSSVLCIGIIISYLPQTCQMIATEEGADSALTFGLVAQWFLLLGATSSASGMLNLWILQWPIVQCCKIVSGGICFENVLGLVQVSLQWLLFCIILILFLVYFPPHLKYCKTIPLEEESAVDAAGGSTDEPQARGTAAGSGADERMPLIPRIVEGEPRLERTLEWKLAVRLATVIAGHLAILTTITVLLLRSLRPGHPLLSAYARFLGLSSTILTIFQYAPQLATTWKLKHVGALSIGTMSIQVPGAVAYVLSLALRDGVEWSTWLSNAVAGVMQGVLLTMCLMWKRRQQKLGIDDFGKPLSQDSLSQEST